jgi:thiol:disulfide interchange protein DsbC
MINLKQCVSSLVLTMVVSFPHAGEMEIRESFAKNLPEAQVGAITKLPQSGLYQVVVNGINIAYTDENGEVGFFGTLMEMKSKTNLTQQAKDNIIAVDFSKLPLDKAFVKVKGTGARKLAVFSDPECPFCQQLEKELQGVNDVTIYTFLFPITELHPDAMRKAELVWCAKDKAQAWDDMMLNKKEPANGDTKCATPIKEIAELAPKFWINGTPGIIFSNGKLVAGALPQQRIEEQLKAIGQVKEKAD